LRIKPVSRFAFVLHAAHMLWLTRISIIPFGGTAMARARRQASASKASTSRAGAAKTRAAAARASAKPGGQFVCPECGRTFSRAAALGAHRSRVHGVAGQSAHAKRNRSSRQQASRRTTPGPTRATAAARTRGRAANQTTARRARQPSTVARRDGVDRDALLRAVFPGGMPAREEVIRAVSGWLDDAERLARMR
jgi:hypothetical protein